MHIHFYIHFKLLIRDQSLSLPWNRELFLGWLATTLFEKLISFIYLLALFQLLAFFMSVNIYIRAFFINFQNMIIELDEAIRSKKLLLIKSMLCEMLDYHMLVKR